ncbi:MAG: hypothetical protein R3250_07940, partial [Melioribacteraceae bacterium]|nr:hypothetical protein [Melioribacteraceae bacterium]
MKKSIFSIILTSILLIQCHTPLGITREPYFSQRGSFADHMNPLQEKNKFQMGYGNNNYSEPDDRLIESENK